MGDEELVVEITLTPAGEGDGGKLCPEQPCAQHVHVLDAPGMVDAGV